MTIDVVFALRADARHKLGGDVAKVAHYQEWLEQIGLATSVAYSPAEVCSVRPRIVHLLNLDLPLENVAYARAARSVGSKVALSTIAHPLAGLQGLYELSADRVFRVLRTMGVGFEKGFAVKEMARRLVRRQGSVTEAGWSALKGFVASQRILLDLVDLILPQNAAELAELRHRFGDLPSEFVVPNGTTFATSTRDNSPARFDVATVGRVEPRKNTLELARIFAHTGHRAVFVGPLSENHRGYAREFKRLVECSDNLTWTGQLPRPHVRDLLARAEAYINGAWCEISSQADVEASSQGCRVVTTRHCFIEEHLDGVVTLDPAHLSRPDAVAQVTRALATAEVPRARWLPTWDEAGTALARGYDVALAGA